MIDFVPDDARIFFYTKYVDMRNGFDGLSFLVHMNFRNEMLSRTYFLFINSKRTRMKMLYWTGHNLIVLYMRSRKKAFFRPINLVSKRIDKSDFQMLLNGEIPKHLICLQDTS